MTKEEALEILKRIIGFDRRELKGEEYDHIWLILQFLDPVQISNNQRSITEVYEQAGKTYYVHYFSTNEPPDQWFNEPPVIEVLDSQ